VRSPCCASHTLPNPRCHGHGGGFRGAGLCEHHLAADCHGRPPGVRACSSVCPSAHLIPFPGLSIYSHPGRLPPTCPAVPGLAIYPHPGHLSPTWPSAPDQLPFPNVFALPVRPPGTTTREAKICFFAALISPFVWHCPERVNEDKRRRRVCRPPRIPNLTPSHKVTPHTAAIIMLTHATHHHCHLRPAIPTPPSRR